MNHCVLLMMYSFSAGATKVRIINAMAVNQPHTVIRLLHKIKRQLLYSTEGHIFIGHNVIFLIWCMKIINHIRSTGYTPQKRCIDFGISEFILDFNKSVIS